LIKTDKAAQETFYFAFAYFDVQGEGDPQLAGLESNLRPYAATQ
jgi:hypothetical protein